MTISRITILHIAGTMLVCASAASAEPVRSIGFRNDGTGVFPDDCRPPPAGRSERGRGDRLRPAANDVQQAPQLSDHVERKRQQQQPGLPGHR